MADIRIHSQSEIKVIQTSLEGSVLTNYNTFELSQMRWSFEKQRLLCVGEDTRPESRQDRSTPASWTSYNIRQHGQWIERNVLLQTRRWFGNTGTFGAVSDSPYLWPARILRCLHGSDQSHYGLNNSVRGRDVESDISNRDSGPVPYVGRVCRWFSPCSEGFLRVLRFSSLHKKPTLQIPIRSGNSGRRASPWDMPLQIPIYFIFYFFFQIRKTVS